MAQQTAVEFLIKAFQGAYGDKVINVVSVQVEQAKEMEKEQIIDAFGVGCQVESTRLIGYQGMAEQYYNETFKSE
jgi:RNA binding exosome subunit